MKDLRSLSRREREIMDIVYVAGRATATEVRLEMDPPPSDSAVRTTLKEVHLYVKSGSSDWVRQEVATPYTPHFTYKVPADGEFWFSLVTVDKSGKQAPSDINSQPPALRVVCPAPDGPSHTAQERRAGCSSNTSDGRPRPSDGAAGRPAGDHP